MSFGQNEGAIDLAKTQLTLTILKDGDKAVSHLLENGLNAFLSPMFTGKQLNGMVKQVAVLVGKWHFINRIVGVGIPIVNLVINLDWSVVPQLVGPHNLEVALHSTQRHTLYDALHLVKDIGASLGKVVDGPPTVPVPQAAVYSLVAN